MSPERIHELLSSAAARYPSRPALQFGASLVSYAELDELARTVASELTGLGVQPGDRVVTIGRNRIEDVVLLYALSHLDAWPVLASARAAPAQLEQIVEHCAPKLVLAPDDALRPAEGQDVRLSAIDMSGTVNDRADPPEPLASSRGNDVAAVLYTSGSTGVPKAAMLSHGNLVFLGMLQQNLRGYTETDKTYCPLPIAHVGALGISLCLMASGGCLYLAERFRPDRLAAAIREDGVTVVPGLPPLHVKFMNWVDENPGQFESGNVRLVTTSSSPLHQEVKDRAENLYGCPLQNAYGLTEATGVIFQVRLDQPRADVSVGPVLPQVDVRIADEEKPLGPGECGEIQARGPNVFLGYYRNPEATRATFTSDGWLRTGDLGTIDEDNAAFITGRAKETIKRSGYTIFPVALEAALNAVPGVSLSAVVSRSVGSDEEIVAFVEAAAGLRKEVIVRALRQSVANYELPDEIRVIQRIPTLANGKIDRVDLRRQAAETGRGIGQANLSA